jgi:hypothetical protein
MKTFTSGKFRYSKGVFYADASDLGFPAGTIPGERLYQDACDYGLGIQSARTGNVVRFYLAHEERNPDEIVCWHYRSIQQERPLELVIYND